MQRLGVLGGTFDPIHQGHVALARQALGQGAVDRVVFLPMARPAHREPEASAEDRLVMCRLALAGEEGISLSEAGMAPGVRYTSDTLPLLRKEFPDSEFVILLGADQARLLPEWRHAKELFTACSFLAFPREGTEGEAAVSRARKAGARMELMAAPCQPFASRQIRKATARYQDAPGLHPQVLCYLAQRGIYQQDLTPQVRRMMNPRRFIHTLGVRQEAVRLADKHGAPVQKAALAGLLHDCAKGMRQKEMEAIARKHHLMPEEGMYDSGALMHGPVGAYVARKQFGIQDEDVLNAIRNHTIGRPGMGLLELCIFVADATEPNREDYEGLQEIRFLAERSLAAAALHSMELTRAFLERTGRPFFPIVLETMADLEARLNEEEKMLLDTYRSK